MKVLLANILLSSSLKSFFDLIALLLIFVFVLLITYAATKWMAGYQKAHYANKNLKVIETVPVGNNKMISLVEAGEVYLVVSIGKDEVNLLAQLTKEQLKDFSFMYENTATNDSFQEVFSKLKDKFQNKK